MCSSGSYVLSPKSDPVRLVDVCGEQLEEDHGRSVSGRVFKVIELVVLNYWLICGVVGGLPGDVLQLNGVNCLGLLH